MAFFNRNRGGRGRMVSNRVMDGLYVMTNEEIMIPKQLAHQARQDAQARKNQARALAKRNNGNDQ